MLEMHIKTWSKERIWKINTSEHTHNQSRNLNVEANTEDYYVLQNLPTASTICGTNSEP